MSNVAYIDEVGMSSIAGPVVCCCVILPESSTPPTEDIKDSKKLSKKKREDLYKCLSDSVIHSFGYASPKTIEKMNIYWARFLAMKHAINKLRDYGIKEIIVDGNKTIPYITDIPQQSLIKADEKLFQVSISSILAKVKRDRVMAKLATIEKYSHYSWNTNAGYFSPAHRLGIIEHGPTHLHRVNFAYFQYCLFCYNKYQEFQEQGKTLEDYLEYEKQEKEKYGKSYYQLWKSGQYNPWKEVKYGERD